MFTISAQKISNIYYIPNYLKKKKIDKTTWNKPVILNQVTLNLTLTSKY